MNTVYCGIHNHFGPDDPIEESESDEREAFIASYIRIKQRAGVRRPYAVLREEAEREFSKPSRGGNTNDALSS